MKQIKIYFHFILKKGIIYYIPTTIQLAYIFQRSWKTYNESHLCKL